MLWTTTISSRVSLWISLPRSFVPKGYNTHVGIPSIYVAIVSMEFAQVLRFLILQETCTHKNPTSQRQSKKT